jgi:1,2-diacylglycerol 3-beta-galactosyltransferase
MRVLVKGFVDNMPDLMAACDAIITKAGPGTISEALICGLPMVLNAYVPCQEEGNIPYVTRNGAGEYQPGADAAAAVVARWLGGGQGELRAAAARAKALGRPGALLDICRDLAALAAPRERGRAAAA